MKEILNRETRETKRWRERKHESEREIRMLDERDSERETKQRDKRVKERKGEIA